MADAAVSFLLQNLKDLGVYFYTLVRDAQSELDGLKEDLERIRAALEDATKGNIYDGQEFKAWEKRIREAVYVAEDLLDDYVTQEFTAAKKSKFVRISQSKIDLAAKLKEFRETRIRKILLETQKVPRGTPAARLSNRMRQQRQIEPLIDKTVVGFEDEITKLKESLLKEYSSGVEVISITGMAGLGKTTVAWKIFRDQEIEHDFPIRIWVMISEEYKPRHIYLTILQNFTQQDFKKMSDHDLAKKCEGYLSQVKFLLVADDIWTDDAWIDIKAALPMKTGSGKVLITSREHDVCLKAKTQEPPLQLRFLHDDESWKLLQIEVYNDENKWPSDSMTIGLDISQKCGGLPLAIVVIGGILKEKTEPQESRLEEWRRISQRTNEYFLNEDKKEVLKNIIALSYNKMPYSLRDCLLYFALYPKDMEISVWRLTRLWISEGFIKENCNDTEQSMEEVALRNLKNLITRNLVIAGKVNARGELKTCRVHDMIREFCKVKALKENFFQLISDQGENSKNQDDCHRISIHSHGLKFLEEKPKGHECTRSFLCFSKHEIEVPANSFRCVVEGYRKLRILDVSLIKFPRYDTSLIKLNHLRYISLAVGEGFKSLPEGIVELWSLQVLIIITSLHTFEIKADIADFRRLRHLKTKAAVVFTGKKKSERKSLENLQTLNRLSTDCCEDSVLSITPNLQTLSVSGNVGSLVEAKCFKHLKNLKKFKMINLSYEKPVSELFSKGSFPPNLKILCLSGTNLDWSYMHTLGSLKLEVIKLKDNAFKGDEWDVSQNEFAHLQYLQIERCNLLMWTMNDGSFRKLTSLFLSNCERLNAVPFGLANTLQTLEMGLVTRSATLSAEKILKKSMSLQRDTGTPLKLKIAPGT